MLLSKARVRHGAGLVWVAGLLALCPAAHALPNAYVVNSDEQHRVAVHGRGERDADAEVARHGRDRRDAPGHGGQRRRQVRLRHQPGRRHRVAVRRQRRPGRCRRWPRRPFPPERARRPWSWASTARALYVTNQGGSSGSRSSRSTRTARCSPRVPATVATSAHAFAIAMSPDGFRPLRHELRQQHRLAVQRSSANGLAGPRRDAVHGRDRATPRWVSPSRPTARMPTSPTTMPTLVSQYTVSRAGSCRP